MERTKLNNMKAKDKTESQAKQILNYLLLGMKLNGMDALRMFKCWRLPARIKQIEDDFGIRAERKLVKTESGKMIAEYWITFKDFSI